MKLVIKGGSLEAEIQGNPIEAIQTQLQQAIQKQDEDISTLGSHVNESISMIHQISGMMAKQISDKARQDIINLQNELSNAISQLLQNDQNNPVIIALQNKVKQLSAMTKTEDNKIAELKTKVNSLAQRKPRTVVKTITKTTKPDDGITKLNDTIQNIRRTPVSKYPKTEFRVRQSIARAGVPTHSSDSNMQDKLNAKPRMPI